MKKSKKWSILASALALTVLCAGAALAAGGDETDPLVTLSYLEQVFLPKVTAEVESQTAAKQEELETQFSNQIAQYQKDMEKNIGDASAAEDSSSFVLVTMSKGQKMTLEIGCELMLRVGTATVESGTNPALIDISTGGTLNKGGSMEKNHLYMATMVSRTVTATADTVKLLVRGGYSIA